MKTRYALGIDIGGSGIKGAIVDLESGEFTTDRLRIVTPQPATPEAVADVVGQIAAHFSEELGDGPIGITVPAVVTHGVTRSAANIDPTWVEAHAENIFEAKLGRDIHIGGFCAFGGVEIRVPDGVNVRNETVAVFGGTDVKHIHPAPGAPTIVLKGLVLFGGVDAKGDKR